LIDGQGPNSEAEGSEAAGDDLKYRQAVDLIIVGAAFSRDQYFGKYFDRG
jgi:hypothetical protein